MNEDTGSIELPEKPLKHLEECVIISDFLQQYESFATLHFCMSFKIVCCLVWVIFGGKSYDPSGTFKLYIRVCVCVCVPMHTCSIRAYASVITHSDIQRNGTALAQRLLAVDLVVFNKDIFKKHYIIRSNR